MFLLLLIYRFAESLPVATAKFREAVDAIQYSYQISRYSSNIDSTAQ